MRKDDPSSRRTTRRRKAGAGATSLELQASVASPARQGRKQRAPAMLDCDFGLALCLLPALKVRRLPDA
jgi:hypothetical protein